MNVDMTIEDAKRLKTTAKVWTHICRGFQLDPKGNKTICLHAQKCVGRWVYGYLVPADDEMSMIYGGSELHEILGGSKQIEVLKDSVCRCTGLIIENGDSFGKLLFEYDVVDAKTTIEGVAKNKTFLFEDAFVYWHAPELSFGLMTSDGKAYPFNHKWSFNIKGTVFDLRKDFLIE